MTEQDQPETNSPQGDLADELRNLGKNLVGILQTAWESEERKRMQREISTGLSDLGATLNEAAAEFNNSSTGQRIKEDVKEFRHNLRSGEIEAKIRTDLLHALQVANAELEKALSQKSPDEPNSRS